MVYESLSASSETHKAINESLQAVGGIMAGTTHETVPPQETTSANNGTGAAPSASQSKEKRAMKTMQDFALMTEKEIDDFLQRKRVYYRV